MNSLFPGRLGIATSKVPHVDRHGLIWLSRGHLHVVEGTLRFIAAESYDLQPGDYAIPYQTVSMVLLGPGTTVTHDALRVLASHGTLLAAVSEGGTKLFTAPPRGQGRSDVARMHALLWADEQNRLAIAFNLFERRFGQPISDKSLSALRGLEGIRLKESYRLIASRYNVSWNGRKYDRQNPEKTDVPNKAINHAATFVEGAADIAVAAVGALPPLGFIHENPSNAFVLDISDLFRIEVTLPIAFQSARYVMDNPEENLERYVRKKTAGIIKQQKLIPKMIDIIKELLNVDDGGSNS